jgi:hypothetical protein
MLDQAYLQPIESGKEGALLLDLAGERPRSAYYVVALFLEAALQSARRADVDRRW